MAGRLERIARIKGDRMEIKELRKALKLTQEEMAQKLGVAAFTVRRWEKGEAKPSQLALRQIGRLERKVKK